MPGRHTASLLVCRPVGTVPHEFSAILMLPQQSPGWGLSFKAQRDAGFVSKPSLMISVHSDTPVLCCWGTFGWRE